MTVCRGLWDMARSLEGWLFPSRVRGAASSELAAWLGPEAEAFAVQLLLPLSLAGPLIPATKDPTSADDLESHTGGMGPAPRLMSHSLPRPALPLQLPVLAAGLLVPQTSTWLPLALRPRGGAAGWPPSSALYTLSCGGGPWPAPLRPLRLGASKGVAGTAGPL